MNTPKTLDNLNAGQAAKYCHLGDKIRRAAWAPGPAIGSRAYAHDNYGPCLINAADILADDWQAIPTEHSV